jgi:hypothetical protein
MQAAHDGGKATGGGRGRRHPEQVEQRGCGNGIHIAHGGFYLFAV